MNNKSDFEISKFLSYVFRHKPEEIWILLDENWWVSVVELLKKLPFDLDISKLKLIVKENDKQRFSFSDDFQKIRASQWHSIAVDLNLEEIVPLDILYHWTAEQNLNSILKNWLDKRQRHHVHLSSNIETASKVWERYWKLVLLKIDAKKMYDEWIIFFISQNWVYLTDFVANKYISVI